MAATLPLYPLDATLTVARAARVLGVHPNTVRSWSDRGRLRYYRINDRGDRRYRLGDLQRFLATAAVQPSPPGATGHAAALLPSAEGGGARRGLSHRQRRIGTELRLPEVYDDRAVGVDLQRHRAELDALAGLASLAATTGDPDTQLATASRLLRDALDLLQVGIWEIRGGALEARAVAVGDDGLPMLPAGALALERALDEGHPVLSMAGSDPALPALLRDCPVIGAPIPGGRRPWGALALVARSGAGLDEDALGLAAAAASFIGTAIRGARLAADVARQLHRAEALRRVATDIGGQLDLDQSLALIADHALVLFEADRAAVYLERAGGSLAPAASRGLSDDYLRVVRGVASSSLPAAAARSRRPLFAIGYRDDPRAADIRAAVVQEGYDTICSAPLIDGERLLGLLNVYHDRPHPWADEELETLGAFAIQACVAIRAAQNYTKMAGWAAQLQSIQQLGARLSRLSTVAEIGAAIAAGLAELINYHNARVYRIYGDELVPVALHGQIGEYTDETPERLRLRVGTGITGWVAEQRIPQNLPDAAKDPRGQSIPGTDEIDESMLLAPLLYEDSCLGVLVLSKLGLDQFSDDDLRLLTIYASFAAQAMANADTTEQLRDRSLALERQLRGQRELLQVTEAILTTLDPRAVFDQVADRLAQIVGYDNISIEVFDPGSGLIRPMTARGVDADEFLRPWAPGEEGLATWVFRHNQPQLVPDELSDPRVRQFGSTGPVAGSLIAVPLRGREGATGVLTLERLGTANRYAEEEFELVKLFAAQVSIALQNAEAHSAVEARARTDPLTGLLNRGMFQDWLARAAIRGDPFSLVMLDLDDFKHVNDDLGHEAGDRVLQLVATAITRAARDSDLAFRYGGDEVALLLPGADQAGARRVAERIQAAIQEVEDPTAEMGGQNLRMSASIGLASFPMDGDTPHDVLLAADRACFLAKRAGRGRIADAGEGLTLGARFTLQEPTPVDTPAHGQ
jgi:diguanylate cyclase (GGDEF)-like protein/excisionase family DNA binding protein